MNHISEDFTGLSTRRIYCDMDDCLTNFTEFFLDQTGLHPKDYEDQHGKEGFWLTVKQIEDFWLNLRPMKHAHPMMEYLYDNFEHVTILSSPSHPSQDRTRAILQKRQWVDKHFGRSTHTIFRMDKEVYAKGGAILIDDFTNKIIKWQLAGGVGILFKSWKETKQQLDIIRKIDARM